MAEAAVASESDDELNMEVLSGFVKTVYETVKEEGVLSPNSSLVKPGTEANTENAKDTNAFHELLSRAATSLKLENTVTEVDKRGLPNGAGNDRLLIPLDSDLSQLCHSVWQRPASLKPVDWQMQQKYRGKGDGEVLTISHPPADSVVVFAASGGRTIKAENFSIPGKETKTLDGVGKKVYQAGGLGLKEANVAFITSQYNQHLWSQLSDILEGLPEETKDKAVELQKEGLAVAASNIQMARDQADGSARTMATGILQRRRVWFSVSGLPTQVESRVLDLPFDGSNLFHSTTEQVIERAKREPIKGNFLRRVNFLSRKATKSKAAKSRPKKPKA
ncbi:uncharacterized protein [Ambystoma mexicanum]|uniref:uncharacterized protein n=1 Tax=Ambystoma mexicanum TaxID=8296 RepID=UPI0037E8E2CE